MAVLDGCRRSVRALLLGAAITCGPALAFEPAQEYQVKVAFLANFLSFVSWPANVQPNAVCVLGTDPFGAVLDQMLAKATRGAATARRVGIGQSLKGCHILFVAASETRRLEGILAAAAASGTLTVGESQQFLDMGGLISLTRHDTRIRIDVDIRAVTSAGFAVSSRLLTLAHIVKAGTRSSS